MLLPASNATPGRATRRSDVIWCNAFGPGVQGHAVDLADSPGAPTASRSVPGPGILRMDQTILLIRWVPWTHGDRVGVSEPLISSSRAEVRKLIVQARPWAERLGKPVRLWMSDKQQAFVTGIAAEFPDVPHRYFSNHFSRDVPKPVQEKDGHAKAQMRRKARGLRGVEREVPDQRRAEENEQQ